MAAPASRAPVLACRSCRRTCPAARGTTSAPGAAWSSRPRSSGGGTSSACRRGIEQLGNCDADYRCRRFGCSRNPPEVSCIACKSQADHHGAQWLSECGAGGALVPLMPRHYLTISAATLESMEDVSRFCDPCAFPCSLPEAAVNCKAFEQRAIEH